MKKLVFGVLLIVGMMFAVGVSSQSSWVGTESMTTGSIIKSAPLKANLDYLFNFKVQKPGDCNIGGQRLGWLNGQWLCETYPPAGDLIGTSCSFNGVSVQDGDSVAGFQTSSVANGQQCSSEVRTCTGGVLSGSYSFGSCAVAAPDSCSFNGRTVTDGSSVIAFQSNTPAFGESCERESRTCSNGTLSGSYPSSTCSVATAQSCSLGAQTVGDGENITTYESLSVTAPEACRPQTRSCSNGALSGSYTNLSCEVTPGTCSSQDLVFNFTVDTERQFGSGGDVTGGLVKNSSCTVSSSLVSDSEVGFTRTYSAPEECRNNGATYAGPGLITDSEHTARCGISGWELSSKNIFTQQSCPDEGTVVEVRDLAYSAERIEPDSRCSCGVSATGGQYGKNVVCVGNFNLAN